RLDPGEVGQAAADHPGRHGHRGQREPAERRRRGVPDRGGGRPGRAEPAAARFPAGVDGRGLRSGDHGPGPGARGGEAVRPHRGVVRRGRPDRDQRGVRRPGARRAEGLGRQGRGDCRPAERQRLGHLARSPDRRDRRANPDHHAARAAPPRRQARAGDDVHRRWSGDGRAHRGGGMTALVAYATYLPKHRLQLSEVASTLGTGSGRGSRVVASFDEDSTTMAVEAAAALLRSYPATPRSIYFATTSPAYLDKTNASAIHAALGLPPEAFAADLAGSARSGMAAWRAAKADGGLAVSAD